MKRYGHLIERIADYDNLALAFYKAQRGKKAQKEVIDYRKNINNNLKVLSERILLGDVDVGHYQKFIIIDPKKREICAAAFDERVLHHAIMNVCQPIFERNLIYDTYATRVGKGVYAALERTKYGMSNYNYVAKMDVRKYFDSISHEILEKLLHKIFKDKILIVVFSKIIDSYHTENGHGVPIGNLTSQYFANYYLSGLDHYAKEILSIPLFIRYMDDILVFGENKVDVVFYAEKIIEYANNNLKLQFKPPIVMSTSQSVSFLGYKHANHIVMLNGRSKKRFCRKMIVYDNLLKNDIWDGKEYLEHITPLLAFTEWSYSKCYRRRIIKFSEGQEL